MNINDLPGGSPRPIHSGSSKVKSPHAKFGANENVDSKPSQATQHSKDPEVVELVKRLEQSPDVRQEKIAEVKQKIESGEFLSRQTAEATAKAFLR